jgi:hypothetical protein
MALNFPANPTVGQTYFNWSWDGVKWTRIAETTAAAGVTSFNTRVGAVTLTTTDVQNAGGAVLSSPVFTGDPKAPTPAPGDNDTSIATTAFVSAAVSSSGVTSFNTRTGAVTLTTADISTAGGAQLNSPAFTGTPTAPTPTAGDNSTTLATTEFVAASYAPINSPSLTGTPQAPTVAAADNSTKIATTAWTQTYVANNAAQHRNRIINGAMLIDQWNSGASITPITGQFVCDRWLYFSTVASCFTSVQGGWNAPLPGGLGSYIQLTSTANTTPGSTDYFQIMQRIEFAQVADFQWGSARAATVSLSFWAFSSIAGTFGGAIGNAAGTRSYPFQFSLLAGIWTAITVVIPGETGGGVWYSAGNAASVIVHFDLGSGSTLRGPPNAWASSNFVGANGSTSTCQTSGAYIAFSNVQLELGSRATPFDLHSLPLTLAACRRYYQNITDATIVACGYAGGAGQLVRSTTSFPMQMRAVPTITFGNISYLNASNLVTGIIGTDTLQCAATGTAQGQAYSIASMTRNAEL